MGSLLTTRVCGAVRGLQTQVSTIRTSFPMLNQDSNDRRRLRARLVAELEAAAANADAGTAFLQSSGIEPVAAAYVRGVGDALWRIATDYRSWAEMARSFATVDRDNWEDDLHSWQRMQYQGDGDRVLRTLAAAIREGQIGTAVVAAAPTQRECVKVRM